MCNTVGYSNILDFMKFIKALFLISLTGRKNLKPDS